MLVEQVKIPSVKKGQEAIGENERRPVDVNEVDQVHHTAPKAEMPEHGGDDDLLRLFRMDPLQDEAPAESETGDKAQHRPPAGTEIEPRNVWAEIGCEEAFAG